MPLFSVGDLNRQYRSILVVGASATAHQGTTLPLNLAPIGAPLQWLRASIDVLLPIPLQLQKGRWHGSASLPIPNWLATKRTVSRPTSSDRRTAAVFSELASA